MKFSENWLREWVNPPVDSDTLSDQLTFLGLEVDEVLPANPGFKKVVIARIDKIRQHPDAKKLRICDVDCGNSDLVQIVCGAANARLGLITALAQVGGELPNGMKIKEAKLRGEDSFGMLCSAAELGLSDSNDGIMELAESAPVGEPLASYLELTDNVIDIELTPDRGDCLSIRGIARDLCAKNDIAMLLHEITDVTAQHDEEWQVRVEANSSCVQYCSRIIRDVNLTEPSPVWLAERLRRAGVRSINPAVDVTNYVMLELGQPMHAFDLDKVQGAIQVREAGEGETVELLDGRTVELSGDTTVIADDSGAIGIAGIMGGNTTAVDESTTNIIFESALFLPERTIGKPRQYGCHTESSHRFERGVDPKLQKEAIEYATGLLMNLAGGSPGSVTHWQDKSGLPLGEPVLLRRSRLHRIIGVPPDPANVETIMQRLGIECERQGDDWTVTPPSYRYDLRIEEDFIEEVARVNGFDSLPRTSPVHSPVFQEVKETFVPLLSIKQQLANRGYQEVVTYSFVDADQQNSLRPDLTALPLANPISSDLAVMRTTLLGGLLDTQRRNQSRQLASLRIFETGLRFLQAGDAVPDTVLDASFHNDLQIGSTLIQQSMLAGLAVGGREPEGWNTTSDEVDFFDVKADVEAMIKNAGGAHITFGECHLDTLHPGQRASVLADGFNVGYIGRLNPGLQVAVDVNEAPVVFEIALKALQSAKLPAASQVSKYPHTRRDLALLVDESINWSALQACIVKAAPPIVHSVLPFDVYAGDKIEKGKKSVAIGLILQDFSRTLEEQEVEAAVSTIMSAVTQQFDAELRG